MRNTIGSASSRISHRFLPAAPLFHRPGTVFLSLLGVLVTLLSNAGNAESDTGPADKARDGALTRISEAARCSRYGINRIVELRVSDDGQAPCEVAYLKPDEDDSTTSLWRARHDLAYCSSRFGEFIVKLENKLSWDCANGVAGAAAVSAALADPTEPPETSVAEADPVNARGDLALTQQTPLSARALNPRPRVPVLAAAAVASGPENNGAGSAVSMDDVRARIPSGPYESIALEGADASACPPGGSFFWNTRNPDQPVFEMGQDAEFTFSTARGRVGQGFALQAEPALTVENDDALRYSVATLNVTGAGTVEAQMLVDEGDESGTSTRTVMICQYRLGGG